ncbi:hypothetical protein QTP86_005177 [Hemibagrus guttatus]|nr:hypothetical protein QTP86_005177 [Hemibagrus guttatus]
MRKSGVAEKYVRVVQDMYERSRTVVRCAVGQTEEFNVEVGLHQGSALSPFLFAIVMDQLSEEVRQESPWTMMFADDIVICSESREQVEENLERWRFALERRGMKVSRSKTEYMCVNEREGSGTVRLQGEEVKKVQEFKYLGSTVQSNGECGKEVKKRVQAGWNGWRKVSGVLCDRKISARIKGKVYRTVVRAAMLYGLETVSLRKRQESELEVAELKMLRDKESDGRVQTFTVLSFGGQRQRQQHTRLECQDRGRTRGRTDGEVELNKCEIQKIWKRRGERRTERNGRNETDEDEEEKQRAEVNESTSPLDVERLATKPRLIRACLALRTETKAHSPAPLNAFMLLSAASLWSRGCAIHPSILPSIHSSLLPSRCTHAPWQPSSTSTSTTTTTTTTTSSSSTSSPTASPLLLMALCQRSRCFTLSGTRALSSLPDSLLSCYMLQSRDDACKKDQAQTLG